MPQYEYIRIIGDCFPDSEAVVPPGGDRFNYDDLIWNTTPIDKAVLEASECAQDSEIEDKKPAPVNAVQRGLNQGDTIRWNATTGQWESFGLSLAVATAMTDLNVDGAGIIKLTFHRSTSNNVKNAWLYSAEVNQASNQLPRVLPFACELVAATFTNQDDDTDTDVEIYTVPAGSGSDSSLWATWEIRNARVAITDSLPSTQFNAGDKIAVYLRDSGREPDRPLIDLYFKVVSTVSTTSTEDFAGNMQSGS